jgi:protocatechuate 3,4-dioxygenase beta subunit
MSDRVHPPHLHPPYLSTVKRAPHERLVAIPTTLANRTGPVFGEQSVGPLDDDLTLNARADGEALGERIVVTGRVLDGDGRAVSNSLIEIWQANSAGRYAHWKDDHRAPLDPNFTGTGRCLTNDQGEYSFTTIRPGAYPWLNHDNAWRPPHIHFSVFGRSFNERLVTQMYFPGDPLLALDPIYGSIPSEAGRRSLISMYDHELTQPGWALGFRFDLVLGGRGQTAFEEAGPG